MYKNFVGILLFRTIILTVPLLNADYAFAGTCIPSIRAPGQSGAELPTAEALLASSIADAHTLMVSCVPAPGDPGQAAFCAALFGKYTSEVATMTSSCTLEVTKNIIILMQPFHPCKYTSAVIYVPDLCPVTSGQ